MKTTDMTLTLDGEAFATLKQQFDLVLGRTLSKMEDNGNDEAVITLKLSIGLENTSRETDTGFRDVTIPKFKHDISSVMQVKDKVSGEFSEERQLVWDDDEGKFVLRKIKDGQMDLFEDADITISGELPEHVEEESETYEEDYPDLEESEADYDYEEPVEDEE